MWKNTKACQMSVHADMPSGSWYGSTGEIDTMHSPDLILLLDLLILIDLCRRVNVLLINK